MVQTVLKSITRQRVELYVPVQTWNLKFCLALQIIILVQGKVRREEEEEAVAEGA